MSVMLIGSSLVTTLLIPAEQFEPGGEANGRALAYLAHELFGDGFGTVYDASTIGILWFAGASAMAGLLNIVPRYLPRYGMAPDWARSTRPLVLVLIADRGHRDARLRRERRQPGRGVCDRRARADDVRRDRGVPHRVAARPPPGEAFFAVVSAIFVYTFVVTIIERPEGLLIASIFIAIIVVISVWSRIARSTELRVQQVTYDEDALQMLERRRSGPAAGALHRQQASARRRGRVPQQAHGRAVGQPPQRARGHLPRGRDQ